MARKSLMHYLIIFLVGVAVEYTLIKTSIFTMEDIRPYAYAWRDTFCFLIIFKLTGYIMYRPKSNNS